MYREYEDNKPWYQQVWPWILIALPASAVVASISTYIIAAHGSSGPIMDDYYKEGLAINRSLERGTQAAALGLTANLLIRPAGLRLLLNNDQVPVSTPLTLVFSHATITGFDQTIALGTASTHALWEGQLKTGLRPGKWYVALSPQGQSWRLTGVLNRGADSVELKPDL